MSSSREDPLRGVYYFRAYDWLAGKVLPVRLVCGSMLLYVVCVGVWNLYRARGNKEKLFLYLIMYIGSFPVLLAVVFYSFVVVRLAQLRVMAEAKSSPLRSGGPETYARITRSSRIVAAWLWGCFAFTWSMSIALHSLRELRDLYGVYDLMGGRGTLEVSMAAIFIAMWTFPMIVISEKARWNHWTWAQMVLLEGRIRGDLCARIDRDDRAAQVRCGRLLREVAMFHSDVRSVADYYYRNVLRTGAVMIFPFGACAMATSFVLFFMDVSVAAKLIMSLTLIDAALLVYLAVTTAQSTIDESERLCEALYDCPWYDWDKDNCVTLIVIMSVMKEPVLKTDMFGVMELNHKAFLKMLRMSYGYMAAVLNLKSAPRNNHYATHR